MKGIPTMKLKKCIMGKNGDRPICIGWFLCLYDVDILHYQKIDKYKWKHRKKNFIDMLR